MQQSALIFTLLLFLFLATHDSLGQNLSDVKYGGFAVEFPQFYDINKFELSRDTVHFYYQGNFVLYAFAYIHDTYKNGVLVDVKKVYEYFMCEQKNRYGLFFPSLLDTANHRWLLKDSLLAKKNIRDYKFQELLVYDSLFYQKLTPDSILLEKYISINSYKDKFIDSLDLYFDAKIQDIPFSLSPSLDSMYAWKCSKFRMVFNSRYYTEKKTWIPRQVWTYELFHQKLPDQIIKEKSLFFLNAKALFN